MVDNDMPGAWPAWTPGAPLAGFIKRNTIHCYKQNKKTLGLVVSEKKIFLCFIHDAPGAGPMWTTGARLAGFIKRITITYLMCPSQEREHSQLNLKQPNLNYHQECKHQ